jgi:penicillin amidase
MLASIYVGKQSDALDHGTFLSSHVKTEVAISYDSYGVPTIRTESDHDAFYAIGYAHAQSRLWQMEMERRRASGRLSEVLGEAALSQDIFMRTLGLDRNAKRVTANLSGNIKQALDAYAQGVNEGIAQLTILPAEFTYFAHTPEPWNVSDSVLKHQLLTFEMGLNLNDELQNYLLLNSLTQEVVAELLPGGIDLNGISITDLPDVLTIRGVLDSVPAEHLKKERSVGSNAWVISGENTVSGAPIIANDPHLLNSLPSAFYMAKIRSKTLNVEGATFPGLPFVASGRNDNVAWAITSMMADTQDVYIERLHSRDIDQYVVDGEYRDMEVYEEIIHIKKEPFKQGRKPHVLKVRRTHRGPIISDMSPISNQTFSLRWTGDDETGASLAGFLNLNYAQNAYDISAALAGYNAPILNILYADKDNNIGSIAPGNYPIREEINGVLPTAGWLSANDWQGWVPASMWPQTANPEQGFVVAANQDVLPEDYPYFISTSWAPGYRATRIKELLIQQLQTDQKLSLEHSKQIQLDSYFVLQDSIQRYLSRAGKPLIPQQILPKNWDGDLDGPIGAIVIVWFAHLNQLMLEDDIDNSGFAPGLFDGFLVRINYPAIAKALDSGNSALCPYRTVKQQKSCDEVIDWALQKAYKELTQKLGDNPNDWQLKDLLTNHYIHVPFSGGKLTGLADEKDNKILKSLYHRTVVGKSSEIGVNAKGINLNNEIRFFQLFGASMRYLIDLGEPQKSMYVLSTGQSGNIFSDNYDDMMYHFNRGEYVLSQSDQQAKSLTIQNQKRVSN